MNCPTQTPTLKKIQYQCFIYKSQKRKKWKRPAVEQDKTVKNMRPYKMAAECNLKINGSSLN